MSPTSYRTALLRYAVTRESYHLHGDCQPFSSSSSVQDRSISGNFSRTQSRVTGIVSIARSFFQVPNPLPAHWERLNSLLPRDLSANPNSSSTGPQRMLYIQSRETRLRNPN